MDHTFEKHSWQEQTTERGDTADQPSTGRAP
jgi:hypothetical protein